MTYRNKDGEFNMDEITRVPNGSNQCRLRATIDGQPADPKRFSPGDSCMCEEDWSIFKVTLDGVWEEM